MKFENCDTTESVVKCAVCAEPANVMTDCIGFTHLPQFTNTAGGWLPVCNLCDKINDQFYDLKLVSFNIGSDYK